MTLATTTDGEVAASHALTPPRRMAKYISALRGPTAMLAGANIGSQAISFVSGLILARSLGAVGRGQVGLVQAYDEVSSNVLSIGTPEASAYLAKEHVDTEARVLGVALKVSLVSLPITAVLGWFVATFAFRDYPTGLQLVAWMAIGSTPFTNAFFSSCRMLLVARGQVKSLVPLQLASVTARLGGMVALIAFGAFTPTTAALSYVLGGWFGQYLGWRAVKVRPKRGGPVRPLLAYGIKTIPASLASMANTRLDQLLVAPLLSAGALGIYSVAIGVNVVPIAAGVAIAQAGYHTVIGTKGSSTGGDRVLRRAVVAITGCSVLSAIGIALLLEPVYGAAFHDSVRAALILVPGSAATGLFLVVWSTGNAIGDPSLAGKAQLGGIVVTLAGLPVMLPRYGVDGAAIVSSAAYTVRLFIGIWLLRRDGVGFRARHRPDTGADGPAPIRSA